MIGEDFERDTNFIKLHVMEIVKRHKREVDEVSTTGTAGTYPGGPGHYFTPYAFSGGRKKDKKKKKKIATAAGMKPVNEGYGEMMDELEKIYRPSGAPPIAKEALKDLAEEYDIGRVLYAARTNKKSFMEVMDMKIDQLQSQFVNKKHINTIKRGKKLREGRYHDWRNDESMTPKQKIGRSMREIRDALNELDKTVKMNLKLKTELKMKSEDYWKNTHKALTKISERLVKMANKVGNLK
jgi:hypothetical protein